MLPVLSVYRPAQWVKNFILFAPILFGRKLGSPEAVGSVVLGFAAFCLVSSAGYVFNAIIDRESDARHPTKRYRPLPSGAMTVRSAVVLLFVALVPGLLVSAYLGRLFAACALGYLLISLSYCLWLKHVVIIDVFAIAFGFVLRMLAGGAAVALVPSSWLILCTMLISVFLGFTKRRAELTLVGADLASARAVLERYSVAFLDQMIAIVTSATLICYVLYTMTATTILTRNPKLLVLTVPFVLYGIFRYLYLVYHRSSGESPTRTIMTDVPLMVDSFLWSAACFVILYFA